MSWKTWLSKYFSGFRTYYLLVITIIVLTLAIQTIVQYSLNRQETTARTINQAGNQRVLAQKLSRLVYACRYSDCDYAELRLTVSKLTQMNHFLRNGNRELGIEPVKDPEILTNFDKITPHLAWFETELTGYASVDRVPIEQLDARVDLYTAIMDDILQYLQRESEGALRTMRLIEVELAFFSVFIVLFEIFFIVNPIIQRLLLQKQKLAEIAWHQSNVFERHFKNIEDLEYVLRAEKNEKRRSEIYAFIQEELGHIRAASRMMHQAVTQTQEDQATPYERAVDQLAHWSRYWLFERRVDPELFDRITRHPVGEERD